MSNKIQVLLIPILTIAFSCKAPNANEIPPSSPDMSQPIVTGIYLTNSMGPEPIGVWGNPSDGSSTISVDYPTFSINSESYVDTLSVLKRVSDVSPGLNILPRDVQLYNPYPNPFTGICVINFTLPIPSDIILFVVPARLGSEKSNDINSSAGAVTVSPKRTAIAVLIRNQLSAGMYACHWIARDQSGNPLPAGFYRIYLRVGDKICWRDVFLYNETTKLPIGLR